MPTLFTFGSSNQYTFTSTFPLDDLDDGSVLADPQTDSKLNPDSYFQFFSQPQDLLNPPTSGIAPSQLIDGSYRWNQGILRIPVAGPAGTPPILVAVHAPYVDRVVKWKYESVGAKPQNLPSWLTSNQFEVLAARTIDPLSPVLVGDGTQQAWRVEGEYVYYLSDPTAADSGLMTGAPPTDLTPASLQTITPDLFNQNILG